MVTFINGLNAGTQFLHSKILLRSLVILDLTLGFDFVNWRNSFSKIFWKQIFLILVTFFHPTFIDKLMDLNIRYVFEVCVILRKYLL